MTYGKSRGGGVLNIAVNKKICCEILLVTVVIHFKRTVNYVKIVSACVYIPPDASFEMYPNHCDAVVESLYCLIFPIIIL